MVEGDRLQLSITASKASTGRSTLPTAETASNAPVPHITRGWRHRYIAGVKRHPQILSNFGEGEKKRTTRMPVPRSDGTSEIVRPLPPSRPLVSEDAWGAALATSLWRAVVCCFRVALSECVCVCTVVDVRCRRMQSARELATLQGEQSDRLWLHCSGSTSHRECECITWPRSASHHNRA